MKKVGLFLSLTVCMMLSMNAQTFPDGSFENNWEYFENPTPGKSDYWDFKDGYFITTLNQLHELSGEQGDAPLTAFRDGDAIDGNYALKLVSNTMTFGEDLFLPGAAGTLFIDFINLDCILGEPFTHRPLQFNGWYKYQLVKGDSAAIEVFLKKNGAKIGGGKMMIYNNVNAWSQFSIPITYSSQSTPDSVVVIFASSAGYNFSSIETLMQCKGQDGSTLYVDDVSFGYVQGVKELIMPEMELIMSPNPVQDKLRIQTTENVKGHVIMYDFSGKEIGRYSFEGNTLSVDISAFASGSYFANLIVNNKVVSSKQFVKE